MSSLRESVDAYVKRVRELAEHVRGNEQATKQSLIGPFFTMLGYDLTDPRECIPEFKADFGKDRSSKPIDWAFKHSGSFAFFVEAKEVGKKLAAYDEQLADYFAKDPAVKLGILTNGANWRFFTDVVNANVMDKEPFATWDILSEDVPPYDVLTLLQKSQYSTELIRSYAQGQRSQNLLVDELSRLLEPSSEFTKLAVANIETRSLTQAVVDSWKPIVANAIQEWAKQRRLTVALTHPVPSTPDAPDSSTKIVTTEEEHAAFAVVKKMLGEARPVEYEDTATYFKVHVAGHRTWVVARLQMDRKNRLLWLPLPSERVTPMCGGRATTAGGLWTGVSIASPDDVAALADLIAVAYASVLEERARPEAPRPPSPGLGEGASANRWRPPSRSIRARSSRYPGQRVRA